MGGPADVVVDSKLAQLLDLQEAVEDMYGGGVEM